MWNLHVPENQRLVFVAWAWFLNKATDVLFLPLSFLSVAPYVGDTNQVWQASGFYLEQWKTVFLSLQNSGPLRLSFYSLNLKILQVENPRGLKVLEVRKCIQRVAQSMRNLMELPQHFHQVIHNGLPGPVRITIIFTSSEQKASYLMPSKLLARLKIFIKLRNQNDTYLKHFISGHINIYYMCLPIIWPEPNPFTLRWVCWL